MGIRMTGLTSGLDTEAIVESLMSAQKAKKTKIENKLTKSEWTKDIWKDLNTKLYSFYTKELTKFKTLDFRRKKSNYIKLKFSHTDKCPSNHINSLNKKITPENARLNTPTKSAQHRAS